MTGTRATTIRHQAAATTRAMVVCDDREVMRLGLVKMLQAMRWSSDLKAFSSLAPAWSHLAASPAPSAIAILGGASAANELASAGRPKNLATQIVLMLRDSEAAHLAVAAELPVDGYFLEEDLSVSMLASLRSRLEEHEFPMPAPMAQFLLGQLRSSTGPFPVRLSTPRAGCPPAHRRRGDEQDHRRRARDHRARGQAPRGEPPQGVGLRQPDRGSGNRDAPWSRRRRAGLGATRNAHEATAGLIAEPQARTSLAADAGP